MIIYNKDDTSTGRISLSKGNQIKVCVGNIWYKADYLGYEGASEIASSDILSQSNITDIISYVKYDFDTLTLNNKRYNGCRSYDFSNGKDIITLDEFFHIYTNNRAEIFLKGLSVKDKIKKTVELVQNNTNINNFGEYLTALFELDAFIYNDDRHFNNIALLHDIKTDNYELCPVFDNGAAFLSDEEEYGKSDKIGLIRKEIKSKPFSENFKEQIGICRSLYGEQLKFNEDVSLSEDIRKTISEHYGSIVLSRIENTVDFSKNIHPEMLSSRILEDI